MTGPQGKEEQHAWLSLALQKGGRPFVRVTSNSMAPLLREGDFAQIEAVDMAELRPDDIIVYAHAESLISHRLWSQAGAAEKRLVTKGDRLDHFDPSHDNPTVLGRVTARRRGSRVLNLDQGAGQRARLLTGRLARLEARLIPMPARRLGQPEHADQAGADGRPRRCTRFLLRQVVYRCAQIIVLLAELVPQPSAERKASE